MFHQNVSTLQLYKPKTLDGLMTSNKLTNVFATQPVEMTGVLAYMGSGMGRNTVMSLLTSYMGNTETLGNDHYRWKLYTGGKRIIDITTPNLDGGTTPGIGRSPFRVTLAEPFFEHGDVVLIDDNITQLQVQGDSTADADNGYIYTFRIVGSNPLAYVDPQYLQAGKRMSKEYNLQAEYSDRGSGISMNTGLELENCLGIFRKTIGVTRSAATDIMAVDLMVQGPNGQMKKTRVWDTAATWKAALEFAEEVDVAHFYGKKENGDKLDVTTGFPIFQGAGFREQISPSNKWEFSKLTYDYLDNFFTDLSYNATPDGGSKKFVVLTGQQGMKDINQVLSDKYKSNAYLLTDSNKFLGGSGDDLELMGHFSKFKLMNGIEVSYKLFPAYDDRNRNRKLDPKTGYPLESSRQTVMNVGINGDNKANIQKIYKKDSSDVMWEVGGSTTSAGTRKGGAQGASGKDGYDVHWLEHSGLKMNDPTSCGELIKVGTPI